MASTGTCQTQNVSGSSRVRRERNKPRLDNGLVNVTFKYNMDPSFFGNYHMSYGLNS